MTTMSQQKSKAHEKSGLTLRDILFLVLIGVSFVAIINNTKKTNLGSTIDLCRSMASVAYPAADQAPVVDPPKAIQAAPVAKPPLPAAVQAQPVASSSAPATSAEGLCLKNPYGPALRDPLSEISTRMDDWLNRADYSRSQIEADAQKYIEQDHSRFSVFDPTMSTCKGEWDCIGGECRLDHSKISCGLDTLKDPSKKCIVYSLGGNDQWNFEEDMLEKTPCEIHTFDCTGPLDRFHKPDNPRLHFHHVCVGNVTLPAPPTCTERKEICGEFKTMKQLQEELGHTQIDLLKMDIEHSEYSVFDTWPLLDAPEADQHILPMQVLVELHYKGGPYGLQAVDFHDLQRTFLQMGYIIINQDDNERCPRCSELTMMRIRCPQTGKYALI